MKHRIRKVKIRVLTSARAHKKMVNFIIPPDIATRLQGCIFYAIVGTPGGSAMIADGQGVAPWTLPSGSFSVFVSRAAALAQAKRISPHKVKRASKI